MLFKLTRKINWRVFRSKINNTAIGKSGEDNEHDSLITSIVFLNIQRLSRQQQTRQNSEWK